MKISASELDVLRSKNQTMEYKIEIYSSTGTLIDTLTDIENFSVALSENAFVRRTFSMAVNNENQEYTFNKQAHGDNLYWYDKTLKFYAKYEGITEYYELGTFKIDDMPNDISKALDMIQISGRGLSKNVITSLFTDIKDYSAGASDTPLTIIASDLGTPLTLENLVANGDFSDGTTGWFNAVSAINNILLTNTWRTFQIGIGTLGHKSFIYAKVRDISGTATDTFIRYSDSTVFNGSGYAQNVWYEVYGIQTSQINTVLQIGATASTAIEVDGTIGVFAIDMTDLGIEDYSEAEMLELVQQGYFEGVKTFKNNIAIGDNLVDYDETITYYATINGVRTKVVSDGTYSNASANKFEADVLIDLKATFGVSEITVTSADTVGSIETSLDGSTWSTFTAGNVRYIRFTISNYDQPNFTINYTALGIVSSSAYPLDNAYDGDIDTFYLPAGTKPVLKFSFASASINTVLLDWNLTDYKQEAVSYEIGYIDSGAYTKIETVTGVAGRVEHAFASATADTIRIEMLAGYGALREITLSNVTVSEKFLDEVIEDILTGVGFSDFTNITPTHFYNDALVFHAGDSKSQAISDIADSIGWEFYFDKAGLPTFRPVYYVDPVYTIEYGKDNIFGQFRIEVSDKVYNQIIVINDNADEGISYTATDDDITSATSTVNIGIRTKNPIRTDKADTLAKAQALAQKELIKAKSERRAFMIQGTALPQLELYDTIRLIDSSRGIDSLCRIDNITWVGEKGRFTNSMRVVEL